MTLFGFGGGQLALFAFAVLLAAFGLSVVLLALPLAFDAIRLAGAAYLLWLAYETVRGQGISFSPRPLWLRVQRWFLGSAFGALAVWLALTPRQAA